MAIDPTTPRSRRAVLGAALGAAAATAANALAQPSIAVATDGQPIIQGQENVGSARTTLRSTANSALLGQSDAPSGPFNGVRGVSASTTGVGVSGAATATAVTATTYGVFGFAQSPRGTGVQGQAIEHGVTGVATGDSGESTGVLGRATGIGYGVHGVAVQGIGVVGEGDAEGVLGIAEAEDGFGVRGFAQGPGESLGVFGMTASGGGIGVKGLADTTLSAARGVFGHTGGGTAVYGWVGVGSEPAPSPRTGVFGRCDLSTDSRGAMGRSAAGIGVFGLTGTGTGVSCQATGVSGVALRVLGPAVFSRSGKATIPIGSNQVQVTNVAVTPQSFVVATIQGPGAAGVYVRNVSVSVANSRFTIRLSQNVSAATLVGWFLVN
jgi:hypothetical protein